MEKSRKIGTKTVYVIMIAMFINGFLACHALYTYWLPMLLDSSPSRTVAGANVFVTIETPMGIRSIPIHNVITNIGEQQAAERFRTGGSYTACLLYTSPSPRDLSTSRMPSSA